MRNTLALLMTGCALLGTVAAHAQNLPVSGVTPASLTFMPGVGGVFNFMGTVTNNTGVTIDSGVPGLALTNPLPTDVTFDTSAFTFAFGPLAPAATYVGTLFTLNIGPAQSNPFDLRFEVQGIDAAGVDVRGGTGVFELRVNSAVPEPGSIALLAGMGLAGLALRRKRK